MSANFQAHARSASARLMALVQQLHGDGYRLGCPDATAAAVDAAIFAGAICSRCGHVGLEYRPFLRDGSYRAFGVCPVCLSVEEV